MADTSIHSALIFVGGHCRAEGLPPSMRTAGLNIAADSGQITAEKCGIVPHIIAGDFDSSPLPENTPAQIVRVPSEKDDTDTMLACDIAIRRGARSITILGAPAVGSTIPCPICFFWKNGRPTESISSCAMEIIGCAFSWTKPCICPRTDSATSP